MDLTGKVVLQQKIDKNQKQIVWQTENIERGLYFIILRLDNRIVSQTKVSVQK
jgi:intracellular septation protein A